MPRKKEKSIRFRCSEEMYDFLDKLRGDPPQQKRMSEVIRNIINVFRVAWLMGDLDLPEMTRKLKEKVEMDTNSLPYGKELAST